MRSELGVLHRFQLAPRTQGDLSRWLLSWLANASDGERATMVQGLYGAMVGKIQCTGWKEDRRGVRYCSISGEGDGGMTVGSWPQEQDCEACTNAEMGATTKMGKKGGMGVVFRNHEGAFLGGACLFFPQSMEPAKIIADEVTATRLHIEMDCKDIVSKLQNKERDVPMLGPMIEEVKQLLETRQECRGIGLGAQLVQLRKGE